MGRVVGRRRAEIAVLRKSLFRILLFLAKRMRNLQALVDSAARESIATYLEHRGLLELERS